MDPENLKEVAYWTSFPSVIFIGVSGQDVEGALCFVI